MNKSILAATSLAAMSVAAPAGAQSLSDAINTALANDCSAFVGTTARFVDVYQVDPNDPALYDFTDGETGGTTTGLPTPELVTDGLGRIFYVQKSNFSPLDPAVVPALTEAEIIDLFRQSGVQNLQISRFEAGAFGAGLAGLCQTVSARTNFNGNSAASGGMAGGSSTASGRSVSSLSSARDQSSKARKRKRKREGRNSSYDDGYVRLASADSGVGVLAEAAGVGPFGVPTFIDLRGGYTDIDRDATALESGFDGRSLWGQGSITAEIAENLAIAGSFAYQRTKGDFDATNSSGSADEFTERNYTGSVFVIAGVPIGAMTGGDLTLDLAAGGFYGGGEGSIERTFATTRTSRFTLDVTDPIMVVDTVSVSVDAPVSDSLEGSYDTRNYGFSAAASISFDLGDFTLTPGVEFIYFRFRQSAYQETSADSFNNGLALSYEAFKDRWTETRIGGAISRRFDVGPAGLRLEGYGDLVLTGGAATPTRTARFAEDLRANPYVLSYEVDDLDKTHARFGVLVAAGLGDGIEAFVGGETTAGHDYLRARTVYAGLRFTP